MKCIIMSHRYSQLFLSKKNNLPKIVLINFVVYQALINQHSAHAVGNSPIVNQGASPSTNISGATPVKKSPPPATILDKDTGQAPENNDMLLGNILGLRSLMAQYGLTLTLVDVNEVWGNPYGGIKQGAAYTGLTTVTLNWDPEKVTGIKNGLFNISALQLRGRAFTAENIGAYNSTSGWEGDRSTRLWELWYQQGFFDNKMTIRIGKLSLDQEFNISDYATLFINSSFGWPMIPSVNTYSGGIDYPVASPAIRFSFQPNDHWTDLFAVADSNPNNVSFCNPSGPFTCDPYSKHQSGTHFNFTTGVFITNEIQYHLNPGNEDDEKYTAYPGTYRLGAFFDSSKFPDQRYNRDGDPLGNPDNPQTMLNHRHTWSVYGIMDQMIWRNPGNKKESLGIFGRIQVSPTDRSPINYAGDAGIVYKGLLNREHDSLGFGWGFAHTGNRARHYDRDYRNFADPYWCVRKTEHHIELAWQIQATSWLELKPDFQYVFRSGGGLNLEENSKKKIPNAAIFGLRSTVNF